ncbi:IS3 family transposase [Alcaligenaceae bacterium]|nr:IS3 family transposase [Alcaligenaceae bacterium]
MSARGGSVPKKAGCLGSSQEAGCAQKTQAVIELRQQHSLATLLKIAKLSRSTFYYQAKIQQGSDKYAALKAQIREVYERHKGCYGYRRITAELHNAGSGVNHKTVQRLIQLLGLRSLVRPKKYRSYRGEINSNVPNVLDRQFRADQPNQKWVTDVTEFNVRGDKLYLSPIMDLYNGEIVAYETRRTPQLPLVSNMLKRALSKLGDRQKPLLHSDSNTVDARCC